MTASNGHASKPLNYLRIFEFLGIEPVRADGDNHWMVCPFCNTPKLSLSTVTGQYQCFKGACAKTGNIFSFIKDFYAKCLGETTEEQYRELAILRPGVAWKTLNNWELAFNPFVDAWMVPIFESKNGVKSLRNLRLWLPDPKKPGKHILYPIPGMKAHIFGLNRLQPKGPIYLTEGEWDAMALNRMLRMAEHPQPYTVLAVPGATTFKPEWAAHFAHRDLILLYDNDEAGEKGMVKVPQVLAKAGVQVTSLKRIQWPSGTRSKYDIRDFVVDHSSDLPTGWETLQGLIGPMLDLDAQVVSAVLPPREKLERTSFSQVVEDFKANLHFGKSFVDALAISFATVLASRTPGDPLWLFLVGPPSSGKTRIIETFMDNDDTEYLSKLTSQALISGWRSGEGDDASYLPKLAGKTVLIKDYTAVKRMPVTVQEELYGLLRDIYDGHCKVPYGNNQVREYTGIFFSLLAGVTDIIHGDNRATLGERFLKVELLDSGFDEEAHIRRAMRNTVNKKVDTEYLRSAVRGLMHHHFTRMAAPDFKLPEIEPEIENKIIALCQIVGQLRAAVERNREEILYRPRAEIGSRNAVQLSRLGSCLALLFDRPTIDDDCYRLVRKVALDSIIGFNLEIITLLMQYPEGLNTRGIAHKLNLPSTVVHRRIHDMLELRTLTYSLSVPTRKGGQTSHLYKVHPRIHDLWTRACGDYLPVAHWLPRRKRLKLEI